MLLFLLLALSSNAATYYVATNGNNTTGDGSVGNPWLTVAKGLLEVDPGDTLNLQQGYYDEVPNANVDGTAGNRITIDGQGVARLKQLDIRGPYYTVQNILFEGFTASYAPTLFIALGSHEVIVTNCTFTMSTNYYVRGLQMESQAVWPWDLNSPSNCVIVNNEFSGGSRVVIGIEGFNTLVQGNYIHDVWRTEAVFQIYGANHIIRSNRVVNVLETSGITGHVDLFETTGNTTFPIKGTTNILAEQNWCENIWGQPVSIVDYGHSESLYGYVFRNNIFIRIKQPAQNTITHSRFYNNTFYDCNWEFDGHAIGWSWSDNENKTPSGTNEYANSGRAFNNVFLHTGNLANSSASAGWYTFTYSDISNPGGLPLTNCIADYNYVSRVSNNIPYQAVNVGTVAVGDGNVWSNQEFYETNGINGGDPRMYGEVIYDFRLLADSPLRSAGLDLTGIEPTWATMTTDFYGNPIDPENPPIGAIAYFDSGTNHRWVDGATGDDGNDGTEESPWETVQHGLDNVTNGQTLFVLAGTYAEDLTSEAHGTVADPITIYGIGRPVLRQFSLAHSNIVVSGFDFAGHAPASAGDADVILSATADNVIIQNCTFANSLYWHGGTTQVSGTKTITGDSAMTAFVPGQLVSFEPGADNTAIVNSGPFTVASVSGANLVVEEAITDTTGVYYISGHRGYFIHAQAGSAGVQLVDNTFSNLSYHAVLMLGSDSTIASNRFVAMQGWDHIQISGTNNVVKANVHLDSPHVTYQSTADIYTDYPSVAWRNITFSNNWVSAVAARIRYDHMSAANTNSTGQVWANNVFIDCNELNFSHSSATITNNFFLRVSKVADSVVNQHNHAIRFQSGYEITNMIVMNNVFLDCGLNGTTNVGWYNIPYTTDITTNYNYAAGAQATYYPKQTFSEVNGVNGGDPSLANISNPIGVDAIAFSDDDGIKPLSASILAGAGFESANIGPYAVTLTAPRTLTVTGTLNVQGTAVFGP